MKSKISSIQIRESVKRELEKLKQKSNESYEDVIVSLISSKQHKKNELEKMIREECEEMAEENLKIAKEGETALMDGLDPNEKWEEYEN